MTNDKKNPDEESTSNSNFDKEVAARIIAEMFGVTPKDLMFRLKKQLAAGLLINISEITDEMALESLDSFHSSGEADAMWRAMGLVPKPGWVSAFTGWHNFQHLWTRGATNKLAGIVGIAYQGLAIALSVYLGVSWYRA